MKADKQNHGSHIFQVLLRWVKLQGIIFSKRKFTLIILCLT